MLGRCRTNADVDSGHAGSAAAELPRRRLPPQQQRNEHRNPHSQPHPNRGRLPNTERANPATRDANFIAFYFSFFVNYVTCRLPARDKVSPRTIPELKLRIVKPVLYGLNPAPSRGISNYFREIIQTPTPARRSPLTTPPPRSPPYRLSQFSRSRRFPQYFLP